MAFRVALQAFEKARNHGADGAFSWHFQSDTLVQLGRALRSDGRPSQAEEAFRRGLTLCEMVETEGLIMASKPSTVLEHHADLIYLLHAAGRGRQAAPAFKKLLELAPKNPNVHNNLAWFLATCQDLKLRDPGQAVELARKAVELAPEERAYWYTLGVAQYRKGEWKAAIEALTKSIVLRNGGDGLSGGGITTPPLDLTRSMVLRNGGDGFNWFFLAMAHWQLGDKPQARSRYDKAVAWMEKYQPKDEELIRFRAEAAALMGVNEKKD
jgi:tetratricopeptide (TPR) repeat protein